MTPADNHSRETALAASRILFLTRSLDRGGAERQLIALATGLHQAGWEVAVACFYPGGAFEAGLVHAGVPIIDLHKKGRYDLPGFLWRWMRVVRRFRPDIVHGYTPVPNMVALLAKVAHRKPAVVWGVRASNMDLARYDRMARISFKLSCFLAKCADLIICNSQAGANHAVDHGYPGVRTRVITNGIDTDRFNFDPLGRLQVRREWRVNEGDVLVGMVGRLDPMKDHPNFLRAAAILTQMDVRCRFVCVGAGAGVYATEMHALGDRLGLSGNLVWAGARNDMSEVYSALDVMVSSSCSEGFPNVIGEAMACGRRCVVTDVGDSAKVVGNLGAVVPAQDPQALANGVLELIKKMFGRLGEWESASRTRILEQHSVAHLISTTQVALVNLVQQQKLHARGKLKPSCADRIR